MSTFSPYGDNGMPPDDSTSQKIMDHNTVHNESATNSVESSSTISQAPETALYILNTNKSAGKRPYSPESPPLSTTVQTTDNEIGSQTTPPSKKQRTEEPKKAVQSQSTQTSTSRIDKGNINELRCMERMQADKLKLETLKGEVAVIERKILNKRRKIFFLMLLYLVGEIKDDVDKLEYVSDMMRKAINDMQ